MSELVQEANKQNMTIHDAMAMPEKDDMIYEGRWHDGISRVCSAFVTSIWKAGGLFDGLEINASEWGPRDVYMVDFFDKNYGETRP